MTRQSCIMLQGNIILTDSNYEILTLLRSHRDDDKGVAIMSRHPYPIRTIRPRASLVPESLTSALAAADDKATLKGQPSALLWSCTCLTRKLAAR